MTLNILLIENDPNIIEIFKSCSDYIESLNIIPAIKDNNLINVYEKNNIDISFVSSTIPNNCPYKTVKNLMQFKNIKESYFVLMLTDENITNNMKKAIETGIHECLVKPDNIELKKILQNKLSYFSNKNRNKDLGIFLLEESLQEIIYNNNILDLTGFEYTLLSFFIKNPMKYFTLQEISKSLYSDLKTDISSDSIKNLIYRIRTKIQSSNKYDVEKIYITSKRHLGYKFHPNGIIFDKNTNLLI
jgi:DNA-binding response OmpR family regulator